MGQIDWVELDVHIFRRIVDTRNCPDQREFIHRLEELLWMKMLIRRMAKLPQDSL